MHYKHFLFKCALKPVLLRITLASLFWCAMSMEVSKDFGFNHRRVIRHELSGCIYAIQSAVHRLLQENPHHDVQAKVLFDMGIERLRSLLKSLDQEDPGLMVGRDSEEEKKGINL